MNKKIKSDPYQILTDKIISKLEQGEIPWKKPWKTLNLGYPKNMISDKVYQGVNFFNILFEDRETPVWVTFKQAKDLGGNVKKGENGIPVVYYNFIERLNGKEEIEKIPFLKRSTVFNIEQCEGIENPYQEQIDTIKKPTVFNNIDNCEKLINSFIDKVAPFEHTNHQKAYYLPSMDSINMPEKDRFYSSENYYSTLFHEMAHSTGHNSRLNRVGIVKQAEKGSSRYAKEELIAELTSAFICNKAGIGEQVIENSTAYIQSWLGALRNDKKLVFNAMKEAYKVIEYLGILNEAA